MKRKPRRTRIQLTVGGAIFLAVTGLILIVGVYTQANLLFWLFGLMIGGGVVSLVMVWLTLRRVRVERLSPGHGTAGEELVLRYRVANDAWLPIFSLVITETWGVGRRGWRTRGPLARRPPMLRGRPRGWVMHLGGRQIIQAEAPCWPMRRGELAFERIVLSCAFPFGVVRKVVEIEQETKVIVYPQLFRLHRPLVQSLSDYDPAGRKQLERGDGTEEFFGLRPYRHGDSLRVIDWKHSARIGELVSREMTQPSPPRIMVLLDLRRVEESLADEADADAGRKQAKHSNGRDAGGSGPEDGQTDSASALHATTAPFSPARRAIERTVSLASSIVCEAHLQGFQVGLAVAGYRMAPFSVHHSLPHCMKILEALAQLDVTEPMRETGRLPVRPSVIVWPGVGEPPPQPGRRLGTLTFGAANMEQYLLESQVSQELLSRRNRLQSRRAALEAEAGERGDGQLHRVPTPPPPTRARDEQTSFIAP